MDNDISPDVIQEQMRQTRSSLSEKVAQLEEQVMGTVQSAADAMQSTVERVKDTMQSVSSSVGETVDSVKESVRSTFDVSSHVRENPWLAVGVAVTAGFVAGRMLSSGTESDRRSAWDSDRDYAPRSQFATRSSAESNTPSEPSWFSRLLDRANEELYRMGDKVMDQVMQALRTGVDEGVPRLISEMEHRITGNGHSSTTHAGV